MGLDLLAKSSRKDAPVDPDRIAGRRVRMLRMPAWLAGVVHPRMGQFGQFAALLARHDAIAPSLGARTLSAYLAGLTAGDASAARIPASR